MIIIQLSGGLGNQMFQYAVYLKLKKLGHDVKFDDITEYTGANARPVQLAAFGIRYPRATAEEISDITDGSLHLADRIRRRLTGRRTTEYREKDLSYDPEVLQHDPGYLVGNYQSERYFDDMTDEIRKAYTFDPANFTDDMRVWEQEIKSTDAVAVHVRRGDYLDAADVYGNICTDAYYDAAIGYMKEKHKDAVFYLFTNDREWADFFIAQHPGIKMLAVRCSAEYTGYLDMYLMTQCRHHIIANSSFSWWGAWLSGPGRDAAAPMIWLNNGKCADIHTKGMILIDREGNINE